MEKPGAVKQTLPTGEISTALQRGARDAAALRCTCARAFDKTAN